MFEKSGRENSTKVTRRFKADFWIFGGPAKHSEQASKIRFALRDV